ncbi:MAG: hypothetical protein COA78_01320 [Blastopirellula sp.]|nr:MAG: hypothetical protein COA78_01320 [Blastopirellula sp.]
MPAFHEIRADFNQQSIVVYQAYSTQIAGPAIKAGRFVGPFSWGRMTWIKPSFLWLMARSNWAQKPGQQHVLAVRISRTGWEQALSQGVLTSYMPKVHRSESDWRAEFENAKVHIQWDPERSIHGKKLQHRSIQVGLSRHVIKEFTEDWILDIKDVTPLVKKIRSLYLAGHQRKAKALLPPERVYAVNETIKQRLAMSES